MENSRELKILNIMTYQTIKMRDMEIELNKLIKDLKECK